VDIDPAQAATMQVPIPNERDHLVVRDHDRLMHPLVVGQKFPATPSVADKEFSIHQLVPRHFIESEQSV
jgi:hypothetical protein